MPRSSTRRSPDGPLPQRLAAFVRWPWVRFVQAQRWRAGILSLIMAPFLIITRACRFSPAICTYRDWRDTINSPTLAYPIPGLPAAGQLLEVADGVHWLRMPLPFALDHINLWLLRDGPGWVIVDCGYGSEATRERWNAIFDAYLGGRPVHRIVVTHLHPDHLGLAAWLAERFHAEVWMTQSEFLQAHTIWAAVGGEAQSRLADICRRHGLDEARAAGIAGRSGAYRQGVPALPAHYRRLLASDTLMIDGRPWQVIVGHGHSPEHAALYCEDLQVLISGDMVLPKITTNVSVGPLEPEGDPLGLFLNSLRRFAGLPSDTLVLPSHGHVFQGLHARLHDLQRHHEERFALILEACGEPRSAADLLGQLFKRELDGHQLSFAMGEAVAHLNYLMHANRLERLTDGVGVHRFVRPRA